MFLIEKSIEITNTNLQLNTQKKNIHNYGILKRFRGKP